jgi:transposase
MTTPEPMPDGIDALKAALAAERTARQQAEARASGAEAMVTHLKLLIAKMKRERYGQTSERGQRLLDQMELQLEELEANAAEGRAPCAPARRRRSPTSAPSASRLGRRFVRPHPPAFNGAPLNLRRTAASRCGWRLLILFREIMTGRMR